MNYGLTAEGVDIKQASWLIQTYKYNVTDSNGKMHTLIVGRHIYARVNGKWKWQTGWWRDYKKVQKWLDKHTSK